MAHQEWKNVFYDYLPPPFFILKDGLFQC